MRDLSRWARENMPPLQRGQVERLIGEILELRNREAQTRQQLEIEGEY